MTISLTDSHRIHAQDFADFIVKSPSSYHAAAEIARRLLACGFTQLNETDVFPVAAGGYFFVRDGAVMAWHIPTTVKPQNPTETGFRILGCHTDSPGFKLKPSGSTVSPDGWGQVEVEMYGGLLLNSWLDREIGFAGRLVSKTGETHLIATGAVARVPQLAVHLDRTVNTDGLKLDPQTHMHPIWTFVYENEAAPSILDHLAQLAGLTDASEISGFDVVSFATEAPATFGFNQEFFAGGRQDNLSSVHAGLTALENYVASEAAKTAKDIAIFAAFDHEEVGSSTRSGASGPMLESLLRRLATALDLDEQGYQQMLAVSSCISADAGHFVHPNYAGNHDPAVHPVPGNGPMLKLNANQRYASDAVGTALWNRVCERAGIAHQRFVSNNAMPCGSTIGPLTATRLGITTVDVGLGLLSMHSAREMSYVVDHSLLRDAVVAYWEGA
ncbi:M18 family aminopeptidase [Gleimia sp. 6138-11-ORH1]|uniref:M18 family aminopeptidase n=1 Tax=Gleimia sp. 6138-11-ORH1 TaxID=2973937 RepID=UPI002167D529|nr:M18 family aminopeptidase [Gleimia sp. 6138-11-ORH1]MCS4484831.1 M18 family aminopeptidase [Gleimia sp. 6138-11-ORH1]